MDFLSDQLINGRVFRLLAVIDVFSRRCLALEADTSIGGARVARVLSRLVETHGSPEVIGTDNGPEFRSRQLDQWAYRKGVKLHFIKPDTPTQNTYIESLNSQIRKRLLTVHWFEGLEEVLHHAEQWRITYNTIKQQTPEEFAAHARLQLATPTSVRHEQNPETTLVGLT